MSNLQPANYLISSKYADAAVRYRVIKSSGNQLLIENILCRSLVVGQRLDIDKETYALVTKVEGEVALAVATKVVSPSFVTISDWTVASLPKSKLLIDPAQAGELYVRCSNTLTEKPGYVGWSLLNGDRELIAIGNDYDSHNICQIKGSGVWEPREYILEVRSFIAGSLHPINYAIKRWVVNTASLALTVGALNDGQPILVLS